jgi:hypothetical protein
MLRTAHLAAGLFTAVLALYTAGSPDRHSQYMESRPSVAALSPEQRASPARLQAMADIAGRTLQGTAHRRLHLVPGAHTGCLVHTATPSAVQLSRCIDQAQRNAHCLIATCQCLVDFAIHFMLLSAGMKLSSDGSMWPARAAAPPLQPRKDQTLHSGDTSAFQVVSGRPLTTNVCDYVV